MLRKAARHRLLALLLPMLWAALPDAAHAQEVRGTVRDGVLRDPLVGAMVSLLDAQDRVVGRVLSGREGTFRLSAPQPGLHRLRVEHIGFADTRTDLFELSAGASREMDVEAATRAIELSGIEVATGSRCEVRPTRGAAAALWEEARKALAAAEWTAGRDLYQIVWTRYERDIAATGRRVLRESRSVRQAATVQPFQSPDPASLLAQGFLQQTPAGQVFAGPDASVLLSDGFLDTHCFTAERRQEEGVSWVGLGFEPVPGRTLPEIAGVIWLEEAGARLRRVEYRYVNLGRQLGQDDAFGELDFRELPNGTWIIEAWRIRSPVLVAQANEFGEVRGYRVLRYVETGGLVNRVATAEGIVVSEGVPGRAVRGVVTDSLGAPAAGAHVWIDGAPIQALSDAQGAFELPGLGDGIWTLAASAPYLEAVGFRGEPVDVDVGRTDVQNLQLRLPSVSGVALQRCAAARAPDQLFEGTRHGDDRGILLGRVLREDGAPAPGADLRIRWSRFALPGQHTGAISIVESAEERLIAIDESGGFLLCNVPPNVGVRFEASTADRLSPLVELVVRERGEVRVGEIVLSELRPLLPEGAAGGAPPAASQQTVPSAVGLDVIGTLLDAESGAPVSAATLELLTPDGGVVRARTLSNVRGAFRLVAPEAGSYLVRASRLALDTVTRGPVELAAGATVNMSLLVRAHPIELPALDVAVEARVRLLGDEGFYERQMGGAGIFLAPEDLSRLNAQRSLEIFYSVPGIRLLEQSGGGPPVLMTQAGLLAEQRDPPPPSNPDARTCLPMIYVDGALAQTGGRDSDGMGRFDLNTIPTSQLLAIEVYRGPAETPARFTGPFAACGVIMIWTNHRIPPPA